MTRSKLIPVEFLLTFCIVGVFIYNYSLIENNRFVSFTPLYKGFAAIDTGAGAMPPSGSLVFRSAEAWTSFSNKYFPDIRLIFSPANAVDFKKENLCCILITSSDNSYGQAAELKQIVLHDNLLLPEYRYSQDGRVYALNCKKAVQIFMILVKIDKDSIPDSLQNIYRE